LRRSSGAICAFNNNELAPQFGAIYAGNSMPEEAVLRNTRQDNAAL